MALDCTCFPVRSSTLLCSPPVHTHTLGPETSFRLRDKNDQISANMAGKVEDVHLRGNLEAEVMLSPQTLIWGAEPGSGLSSPTCENWDDPPRPTPRSIHTSLTSLLVCWGIMDVSHTLELCCLSRFCFGVGGCVYLITTSNMVLMLWERAAV